MCYRPPPPVSARWQRDNGERLVVARADPQPLPESAIQHEVGETSGRSDEPEVCAPPRYAAKDQTQAQGATVSSWGPGDHLDGQDIEIEGQVRILSFSKLFKFQ